MSNDYDYESVSEQVRFIVWLSLAVLIGVGAIMAVAL
jgi:hypothetical protein